MSNYTPEVGALIKAGSMLANCAFNLEQIERLTLRERRSLDESRKAWDEAHSAYAATLRQQAGMVDEDARDAVAKAIADVIGHGMREKCYAHADAVLAAIAQNTQGDGEAVAWTLKWPEDKTVNVLTTFPSRKSAEAYAEGCKGSPEIVPLYLHAERAGVPDRDVRLWDTQWLNIVDHDNCYRDWDKADAINHAVKMTEQAIARNVADGKLPPPRIAAPPHPAPAKSVRCTAHVVHPKSSAPRPHNPPLWCCLPEGHVGQHRHNGGGMYPSIPFRDTDEISMEPAAPSQRAEVKP